jgi:exopolyphosphatase / guanosine-5'-triphosphate,3'-diphosphate pyrophosphatase
MYFRPRAGEVRALSENLEREQQPNFRSGRDMGGAGIFAALDLGTNNCRLLVARPERGSFRVLDAYSRIVRLGEQVAASGMLLDAAMERTLAALSVCADKMRRRQVTSYRGVATQACREARNGPDFLGRIEQETGLQLDLIAPAEEARLAVTGCMPLLDPHVPDAVMFDIGGGSTEIMLLRRADNVWRMIDWLSMPHGVVTLAEREGVDILSDETYRRLAGEIAAGLALFDARHDLADRLRQGSVQMIGTSGTVTTLAGVHLRLRRYSRAAVDGAWLGASEIVAAIGTIRGLSPAERVNHPCVGSDRGDLVVPGCAILDGILAVWPVARLRVADRGLREGIIVELMREAGIKLSRPTVIS